MVLKIDYKYCKSLTIDDEDYNIKDIHKHIYMYLIHLYQKLLGLNKQELISRESNMGFETITKASEQTELRLRKVQEEYKKYS